MSSNAAPSSRWTRFAESNPVTEFIDTSLRGCAQVMFQNNPLTGLIFFIAIFIGAYSENNMAVAYGCVLGTLTSTLTGYLDSYDKVSLRAGLFGYNGCLVGAALPTFMAATPILWLCIILGSIISVIVTACIADVLKTWKVAALTAPFVLTTWVILLASYKFLGLHNTGLPIPTLPHSLLPSQEYVYRFNNILPNIFNGVSEVFLISNVIVGAIFVIGLAVESLWAAVFAVFGSILAVVTAIFLGADGASINSGLYSFSAVLTSIALGATFNKPSWRVVIYTFIGVLFTVFMQGALDVLLAPIGIPTLTMPFVLASWLFLVPNKDLMPEHRR